MLFNWLKKKVVNSLIDEAIKKLPELKEKALEYIKTHKDEIINELLEKIKELVTDFVQNKLKK